MQRRPALATVLDLGCGAGEPIARYLIQRGCRLTGVDVAPAMIARCRRRFADHAWRVGDMRRLDLARHGFAVLAHVPDDPGCDHHTVWLARRLPPPTRPSDAPTTD